MSYARNGKDSGRYQPVDQAVSAIQIAVLGEELNVLKGIVKDLAVMVDRLRQRMDERDLPPDEEVEETPKKEEKEKSTVPWSICVLSRLYQYRYYLTAGAIGVGILADRWNRPDYVAHRK